MSKGRIDFRAQLGRLRWGISLAWLLNVLCLTGVLVASASLIFMDTTWSNEQIGSFLLVVVAIALPVTMLVVTIMSHFSYKMLKKQAAPNSQKVESGPVFNVVEEVAIAAGLSSKEFPEIYISHDRVPNAFALGTPRGSMIVFTDSLLSLMTREQLKAIAAHEVGHIVAGDSKMMTKLIAMSSLVGLFSGFYFRGSNSRGGGARNPLAIAIIVLSVVFLLVAPLLAQMAQLFMSRKRESQADAISVKLTRNPTALAEGLAVLEGIHQNNPKSVLQSSPLRKAKQLAFFSFGKSMRTHPTTEKRIADLVRMGANFSLPGSQEG